MTEEQLTNIGDNQNTLPPEPALELANRPVVVPGQETKEPDDMFGDIDSLKVDAPAVNPNLSVEQAQAAVAVSGGKASSILLKVLIVVVALVVVVGAIMVAYPYVKSMFSADEAAVILVEPEEVVVDNAYSFPEEDYTVTDEMIMAVDNKPNSNDLAPIANEDENAASADDLMVDVNVPLSEIINGDGNTVTEEEPVNPEDSAGIDDTVVVDLNKDTDNDGLTDEEESKLGTHTMKADTDNDSLSDRDEVMTHKTNPLEFDSDGDGLSDYDELMVYKSDPLKSDTDGDGYTDGVEVSGGYNPNGPGQLEI